MTEQSTFAQRVRAAKPRATKHEVRDDVVSGLALAIQPTGVRTFFLSRMVRGRRRYATIGSADAVTITGCRRGEVLDLRWRDIGADALNLEDSKTGPRSVPLGQAARAVIGALPGPSNPEAFLFPCHAEGRGEWSLTNCWRTLSADAGLGRLRLHDLRHTAASQAVMAGENLPLVGKLLGHRQHRTTAGYAHLADAHLVEAAEKVGRLVARAMERRAESPPPPPTPARTEDRAACCRHAARQSGLRLR